LYTGRRKWCLHDTHLQFASKFCPTVVATC
jgi:hypothetical protein